MQAGSLTCTLKPRSSHSVCHVERRSRDVPNDARSSSPSNRIPAVPNRLDAATVSSTAPMIYITATGLDHPPRAMIAGTGTPAAHASVAIPARSE